MSLLGEMKRASGAARVAATDRGVLRFITAGSVDDGKSTLIGRLLHDSRAIFSDQHEAVSRASRRRGHDEVDLSLFTDGLEAEREQGITIDVAYRHFATPARKFIIADTPGHEQYTRNMATGASTAEVAVILVDARKGVLPQTRRHAAIAALLGIRHLFVAVNKMDLAGWEYPVFKSIRDEFSEFAASLGVRDLRFFPVSALQGDNIARRGIDCGWHDGPTLLEALESVEVADHALAAPLRFPVQLVVRDADNDFRGYAGRVESGAIFEGQSLLVLPSGRTARVREIRRGDARLPLAVAGDSVTVRLAEDVDLARGDWLADAERPSAVLGTLDADLVWLDADVAAPGAKFLLRHGTRMVKARLMNLRHRLDITTLEPVATESLSMNDIARVTLALSQPVFADDYLANRSGGAFVLIDALTNRTLAAGMIRQAR